MAQGHSLGPHGRRGRRLGRRRNGAPLIAAPRANRIRLVQADLCGGVNAATRVGLHAGNCDTLETASECVRRAESAL